MKLACEERSRANHYNNW